MTQFYPNLFGWGIFLILFLIFNKDDYYYTVIIFKILNRFFFTF